MPFNLLIYLEWIRDYGWILAIIGYGLIWMVYQTSNPVLEVLMTLVFTASTVLLLGSIVLHFVSFDDLTKRKEARPRSFVAAPRG